MKSWQCLVKINKFDNVWIFICDQAALRTLLSVCPSVRLSVCPPVTPFSQCSCHRIIMKFSGVIHDDVIKWKHFPCYWPFVQDIHLSPVNSPHKGQWCGASMFSLICVWINGWVNNREAGYLRLYHTHYKVIVMYHWQKWYPCKRSRSKVKVTKVKTNFVPIWVFLDCNSSLNPQMATKWCTKLAVA